jgi:hypothetical protein
MAVILDRDRSSPCWRTWLCRRTGPRAVVSRRRRGQAAVRTGTAAGWLAQGVAKTRRCRIERRLRRASARHNRKSCPFVRTAGPSRTDRLAGYTVHLPIGMRSLRTSLFCKRPVWLAVSDPLVCRPSFPGVMQLWRLTGTSPYLEGPNNS